MNGWSIRICRGSPHKPGMFVPDVVRDVRQTVRRSAIPDLEITLDGVEQPGSFARREGCLGQ